MSNRCFTIAPSDLSFLIRECQRCFYLKVSKGIRRPSSPFPGVFTKMDLAQRDFFDGKSASSLITDFPSGILHTRNLSIRSRPLPFNTKNGQVSVVFRGAMDAIVVGSRDGANVVLLPSTAVANECSTGGAAALASTSYNLASLGAAANNIGEVFATNSNCAALAAR